MRIPSSLCLSFILLAACGGSRSVGDKQAVPTSTAQEPETPAKKLQSVLHVAIEMELKSTTPQTTQVTLVETNETGSNTRHDLGVFEGECADATKAVRATESKVFLAFHCKPSEGQRGVLVHIIHRQSRLVLLRAWLGTSKPEFDDFDQIAELPPMETGVALQTDHD